MKRVVVTGTSSGIGLETVRALLPTCEVLAISRRTDILSAEKHVNCHIISADITVEKDLEKVVDFIKKSEWGIDALINNAGKICNKPFEATTTEDFLEVYKVNVFAVAALTKKLLPYLKENSHVVNISSMGGVQGSIKFPGLSAYSSSKGALIILTELLSETYKNKGISFNVLALGAVQTAMLTKAFPGYKATMNPEKIGAYIKNFALEGHHFYNGKVLHLTTTTP